MNRAFSLVELSIVLVILGLLTGGILTGQSLIRAAELRSVTTEFNNYQTAVQTFRGKYFSIPGDMANAEAFWGTMATGTCPNATAGTGTQTCNGDGDGQIDGAGAAGQFSERFSFWQHMAASGLIEGRYTGITGAGGSDHHISGENNPASKLSNASWSVAFRTPAASHFVRTYNHTFFIGANRNNDAPFNGAFSCEEAWGVDKKIDDGLPAQGKVGVLPFGAGGCNTAANATDLTATYALSDDSTETFINFSDVF